MFQGADIDIRVVRDGRGPDCNVWSNFKQVNSLIPIGSFLMVIRNSCGCCLMRQYNYCISEVPCICLSLVQASLIYPFCHAIMQYGLPMPLGLLRADNNLPPWRPGLKEVTTCSL